MIDIVVEINPVEIDATVAAAPAITTLVTVQSVGMTVTNGAGMTSTVNESPIIVQVGAPGTIQGSVSAQPITVTVSAVGAPGPKGDAGETGPAGQKGDKGDAGGVTPPTLPAFAPVVDAIKGSPTESNIITVAGDATQVWPVVVRGDGNPQMQINGGVWVTSGIVSAGDTVKVKLTASFASYSERVATLKAPSSNAAFSVTSGGLWTPGQLDSLAMMLDYSVPGSMVIEEGVIAEWQDLSGRGRHASQPTPAARPTLTPNGVEFDGANDMLRTSIPAPVAFVAAVFRSMQTVWSSYGSILETAASPRMGAIFENGNTMFHGNPLPNATWKNGLSQLPSQSFAPITDDFILCLQFNNTLAGGGVQLIGGLENGYATRLLVKDVIALDVMPDQSTRQALEGYLAHRRGLTGVLPADHPYKVLPP